MNWLVEDFHAELGYKDLCSEIVKQGHNLKTLSLRDVYEEDSCYFPQGETTLFQGSLGMAQTLLRKNYWKPTAWLNIPAYDCWNYYPAFEGLLFNDRHIFASASAIEEQGLYLWNRLGGESKCVFLRPSSVLKSFGGTVETLEEYQKASKGWRSNFVKPDDLILLSTAKNIRREWRFVTDGVDVISCSQYKNGGKNEVISGAPFDVAKFAFEVIRRGYNPDPLWCFDICEDDDFKTWLLEIGSFSCSGLYKCPTERIVKRASELALEKV